MNQAAKEQPDKLPSHVIRFVEGELESYGVLLATKAELMYDCQDLLNKSRQICESPGGGGGEQDKVSLQAIKLVSLEERIKDVSRRINRIENGIAVLLPNERELVELKYFSNRALSNDQVMEELHISGRGRYYAIKNQALRKFATIFQAVNGY